jgi:hypothetical protein
MNPKKKLTFGQSVSVVLGLCFTVGILTNIFKKPAVQPAAAPAAQTVLPAPSPVADRQSSLIPKNPTAGSDFKQSLPAEDSRLRDTIRADEFLNGYLGNVWIGYADRADLISRGFFINPMYKHVGEGEGNAATAKGACSPIGFNGAFICGKGMMAPHQWGIQSDDAIGHLNQLEEGWSGGPQSNTASPATLVADRSEPLPDIAPECKAQIDAVSQQIRQIKGLKLKQSRTETFSGGELEGYYPNGRNRTAGFIVENQGPAPASFMQSPELLTQLGTQIINACADLSTVSFSVDRSGWIETIGIFDDGAIRRFGCIEDIVDRPNTRERLPYGYINCAL